MKPQTIGRALGIGLRVAGRIAGQRMAAAGSTSAGQPAAPYAEQRAVSQGARNRVAGQATGQAARGMVRGVGGFLRPFGRVGGILWLEVTGVFFALFALVFGIAMWRTHPASMHGPFDKAFVASAALLAVFLYLSVSSFLRAGRK